ncbi:hypothetical protein B0H14DRAFT_3898223 [Mycena olivaceomarginata]|nr:hypothetical protein B0H14DRAFT_3898223 [Mycena olivaceomarginata]
MSSKEPLGPTLMNSRCRRPHEQRFENPAIQPTGLADFGDNLAVHPTPFDDLDAMVNPSIPFSNVWDLKSAQGAHLGFRGKATADRRPQRRRQSSTSTTAAQTTLLANANTTGRSAPPDFLLVLVLGLPTYTDFSAGSTRPTRTPPQAAPAPIRTRVSSTPRNGPALPYSLRPPPEYPPPTEEGYPYADETDPDTDPGTSSSPRARRR